MSITGVSSGIGRPVAERATPRKAGGVSTGKAETGSVMMPSAGKHEARPFNDSRPAPF